jgi:methylmalonyl-CoA mutase N-terminal domain/subunit
VRAERDAARHQALIEKLVSVAKDDRQNIMPITIEAVETGATMGEIVDALKKLWGTYRENPVF